MRNYNRKPSYSKISIFFLLLKINLIIAIALTLLAKTTNKYLLYCWCPGMGFDVTTIILLPLLTQEPELAYLAAFWMTWTKVLVWIIFFTLIHRRLRGLKSEEAVFQRWANYSLTMWYSLAATLKLQQKFFVAYGLNLIPDDLLTYLVLTDLGNFVIEGLTVIIGMFVVVIFWKHFNTSYLRIFRGLLIVDFFFFPIWGYIYYTIKDWVAILVKVLPRYVRKFRFFCILSRWCVHRFGYKGLREMWLVLFMNSELLKRNPWLYNLIQYIRNRGGRRKGL